MIGAYRLPLKTTSAYRIHTEIDKKVLIITGVVQSAFKTHMCFFVRFFHSHCFFFSRNIQKALFSAFF